MQEDTRRLRCSFIDELRGFAVFCMVIYHALFTVGFLFDRPTARDMLSFFSPLEPFFAALFIFISGFCTRFSHNVLRRGGFTALAAALISAVTFAASFLGLDIVIWFGVVHLIAVSMLLWGALRRILYKIPPAAGLVFCLLVFVLTFDLQNGFLGVRGLLALKLPDGIRAGGVLTVFGLCSRSFSAVDYFPVFPWLFIFFAGGFFGRLVRDPLPPPLFKKRVPPLAFLGRHALLVYLVHQPVIFAVCSLLYR